MAEKKPETELDTKKADAAKDEKAEKKPSKPARTVPLVATIVAAAVCLVLGGVVGHFCFNGTSSLGSQTLQEANLDTVVARYAYNGQTYEITAKDVITQSSSLDSAANDDGSYTVPTADSIIDLARNQIMQKVVDAQGITVSDDDMDAYAQQYLGSTDYATIASNYNMDEDSVRNLVRQSCALSKLRSQVVTAEIPSQPTAPSKPADGAEDTPTADYATYIINLAGDEWDSKTGTWKDSSSTYASALADYQITNDSATYAAAQAAYYVAYQQYSTASQTASQQWTNYVNDQLSKASIEIYTMEA
ncbi:MAG: hypothetical protein LKE27_04335 [Atopobiaceae bacterium]|jgi:hypothetical protein|nr:hypothetical protein [Atopobiaceae bacterium]